jgi:hypothetical protein
MRRLVCSVVLVLVTGGAAVAGPCDPTCTVNKASGDVTSACDYFCSAGIACIVAAANDVCPYTGHNGTAGPSNGVVCQSDSECTTSPFFNCAPGGGDATTTVCGTSSADVIIASFANAWSAATAETMRSGTSPPGRSSRTATMGATS